MLFLSYGSYYCYVTVSLNSVIKYLVSVKLYHHWFKFQFVLRIAQRMDATLLALTDVIIAMRDRSLPQAEHVDVCISAVKVFNW